MSKEEMEAHAKRYSQTYRSQYEYVRNSSKWTTDFDAMALKTVCKLNISKNGPMSVELADAIMADQSVMRESEKDYHYEDNTQDAVSEAQAQAVADKFKDFADFEDVEPKTEK
jgi:recombination protein RecT